MATMSAQRGLNVATGLPSNMLEPATAAGGGSLSRPNRHASLRFASGTSDGNGAAAGGLSSRDSSNRNTNRYSVTALYSMAAEQDTEIEDELARCTSDPFTWLSYMLTRVLRDAQCSPETPTGPQGQDLDPVEAQLCA